MGIAGQSEWQHFRKCISVIHKQQTDRCPGGMNICLPKSVQHQRNSAACIKEIGTHIRRTVQRAQIGNVPFFKSAPVEFKVERNGKNPVQGRWRFNGQEDYFSKTVENNTSGYTYKPLRVIFVIFSLRLKKVPVYHPKGSFSPDRQGIGINPDH